jgi:Na+-driven multidrug efflux pump
VFQTLGKAGLAFLLSISRQVLFVIPLVLLLPGVLNPPLLGVWSAFPLADFLSFLVTGFFLLREMRKLRSASSENPDLGQ